MSDWGDASQLYDTSFIVCTGERGRGLASRSRSHIGERARECGQEDVGVGVGVGAGVGADVLDCGRSCRCVEGVSAHVGAVGVSRE